MKKIQQMVRATTAYSTLRFANAKTFIALLARTHCPGSTNAPMSRRIASFVACPLMIVNASLPTASTNLGHHHP